MIRTSTPIRLLTSATLVAAVCLLLTAVAPPAHGASAGLSGRWVLNDDLTREVQPDGPRQRQSLADLPRPSISVGGIPLPGSGGAQMPSVAGTAPDPRVLRCAELIIEPQGDVLHLRYTGAGSESLERGNDQGLRSRWTDRKLTTRYATTSRKVRQQFHVRRDGRLLVTVRLSPDRGPTVVHKRVFDRAR